MCVFVCVLGYAWGGGRGMALRGLLARTEVQADDERVGGVPGGKVELLLVLVHQSRQAITPEGGDEWVASVAVNIAEEEEAGGGGRFRRD